MTERVDFYILESTEEDAHYIVACRIAEKGFQQGLRVYVRTESEQLARQLDELLWSFSGPSFLPHRMVNADPGGSMQNPAKPEVLVGAVAAPRDYRDLLVSLVDVVPEDVGQFDRIADLIPNQETHKRRGRARFRTYRERGLEPTIHNL